MLDLGYEKIHACPNDCMLFWGGKDGDSCHVCGSSRWVTNKENVTDDLGGEISTLTKRKKTS